MSTDRRPTLAPVLVALTGGAVAVGIGAAVMLVDGGAQASFYALVNAVTLLVGVALAGLLLTVPPRAEGWLALAAALALLATALVGVESDGIRRWVSLVGGVQVHLAFVLLPLLLCSYARHPGDRFHAAALGIAALAVAIMPDRSMAMPLTMVACVIWLAERTRTAALVLLSALFALAITCWRPDPLTGVPFVEHVLVVGWQTGLLTGATLTLGALAMLTPFLTVRIAATIQQRAIIAFTFTWGFLLIASIIAPYPTPLLGYGPSAIIGYFLSVVALRKPARVLESP